MFKKKKIFIGVIHLLPLPGAPLYRKFSLVKRRALREAKILEDNGADAIIVENFWDVPFKIKVELGTIVGMSIIANEIRKAITIPFGINLLRNDGKSALAIATISQAEFIRVNVLSGVRVAPEGLIIGEGAEILRYKKKLNSTVKIFADVNVKHSRPLVPNEVIFEAIELEKRCLADTLIITGPITGKSPKLSELNLIKKNVKLPVFVGSGITRTNISKYLTIADGVIVGTYLRNGNLKKIIDKTRVRELSDIINTF